MHLFDLRGFGKDLSDLWASRSAACGGPWRDKTESCDLYAIASSALGWMSACLAGYWPAGWPHHPNIIKPFETVRGHQIRVNPVGGGTHRRWPGTGHHPAPPGKSF